MNKHKTFTTINYVISGVLWLLGILTFLFNAFGKWTAWQLAGFGFMYYIPIPAVSQCLAIIRSLQAKEKKYIMINLICFVISVGFVFFTVYVSARWFW